MSAKKARQGPDKRRPIPVDPPQPPGPARRDARAAPGGTEDAGTAGAVAPFAASALALAFYFWMIGGPAPMPNVELRAAGLEPLAGLATALGLGLVSAAVIAFAMTAWAPLRPLRGSVALASAGLYLAAGVPAIGKAALVLAPLAAGGHLAWLVATKARVPSGSLIVALQAGAFVSAAGFFHDWARYAAAWEPFVRNLHALKALLL